MAFVLVQHLDPTHQSLLTEIIARSTLLPVEEVKAGAKIRPGRVYVIPPDAFIAIQEGAFHLTPRERKPDQHMAINFFMRSLAEESGSRAIGIVLSGTGTDGTLGIADIKAEGGITFAQHPASAKYDGMPHSAIASGFVDFVLTPQAMAGELERIHRHPYVRHDDIEPVTRAAPDIRRPPEDLSEIVASLRKHSGVDFGLYKPNTIHRRVLRRMLILKLDSASEYAAHLKDHPAELDKLYDDILIPVTRFFRDPEAFAALKAKVFPAIVKNKTNKGAIRIWAPGCSTGEETYSLAIALLEVLGDKASSYQVQIFGTDLNERGIVKARAGIYRASISEEVSRERLDRFFVKVEEGYRVNKAVRDLCVFARQDLTSDPPFSQMNLVACRNLLIYLSPILQKRVVPILHYALRSPGFLFLGRSETISGFPNLFSVVDAKHRLFAKKPLASRLHYDFSQVSYPSSHRPSVAGQAGLATAAETASAVQAEADRLVLNSYAPVGVVVNDALEVVHFRGRTTPYLEPVAGRASLHLLKMAQGGLPSELRALVAAARKSGATARKSGVRFKANSVERLLNVSVSPLLAGSSGKERHFLVLFEETPWHKTAVRHPQSLATKDSGGKREIRLLRQQLEDAQHALRGAAEAEEATREEFQSANEEVLSANEELQSTNEELETSKEELQSTNEELNTLNEELRYKNIELHALSNDVTNFLASSRIPIVMVDGGLRIRRLTPTAGALVKAAPSDVGRLLSDLRLNLKLMDLEPLIRTVLDTLQPATHEVQDLSDRWHTLHILPYRTLENKIDGAVLALHDIHDLKTANEDLRRSTDFFRGIINTVREPLLVLDSDLRVIAANDPFQHAFNLPLAQVVNQFLYRLGEGQWNIPRLRALLEQVIEGPPITDFAMEHAFPGIGDRSLVLNARRLQQARVDQSMILLAIEDVTDRKNVETALITSEKLAAAGRVTAALAHEINNPLQSVTNLIGLLGESTALDSRDKEFVGLAAQELNRVVHLVRQSLGLFRNAATATAVNVEDLFESVLALYSSHIAGKEITVTRRYRITENMRTSAPEIRQIFATLLVNAIEACGQGGNIHLRARQSSDWRDPARSGIRITVVDDGQGITPPNPARVFEPFYSTKGDRGTGLGLWIASGIARRLGGSMRVRSRVTETNPGTCFSVFVPQPSAE